MASRVLANNWGETRRQLVALVTAVVTRAEAARHSRRGMVCLPRKLSVAAVTMMVQGMPNRDKQHVESCQGEGSRSDNSDVQKTPWFGRVSESQVPCTTQVSLYHPGFLALPRLPCTAQASLYCPGLTIVSRIITGQQAKYRPAQTGILACHRTSTSQIPTSPFSWTAPGILMRK